MGEIPDLVLGSVQRAPWGWALLGTVLIALIKTWPIIQLQVINARAQLRGEERTDLGDCKTRLDSMGKELADAVRRIHDLEMRLLGTVSAYRILEADATERNPDGSALHQAQVVFRTVWDHTGPIPADMLATVAQVQ